MVSLPAVPTLRHGTGELHIRVYIQEFPAKFVNQPITYVYETEGSQTKRAASAPASVCSRVSSAGTTADLSPVEGAITATCNSRSSGEARTICDKRTGTKIHSPQMYICIRSTSSYEIMQERVFCLNFSPFSSDNRLCDGISARSLAGKLTR